MLRKNDQNMFNASNAIKNERFSFENKYANIFFFFIYHTNKIVFVWNKNKEEKKTKQKNKNKAIDLYVLFEKCFLTNMIVECRVMCRPISAFYTDTRNG